MRRVATLLGMLLTTASAADRLSLAGSWQVRIDEADVGLRARWFAADLEPVRSVVLPGSLADSGLGHPFDPHRGQYEGLSPPALQWPAAAPRTGLRRDALGTLVPTRMTWGPAWFTRTVTIPPAWAGRPLRLRLERVKWTSRLWVDGRAVSGSGVRSLAGPHLYDLGRLPAGPHRLTLRVDNRPAVPLGLAGHAYGLETEALWLGVAGRLEIEVRDAYRLEHPRVVPDAGTHRVRVQATLVCDRPLSPGAGLTLRLCEPGTERCVGQVTYPLDGATGTVSRSWDMPLTAPVRLWDEFHPQCYDLHWRILSADRPVHEGARRVGLRRLARDGRRLLLNGRPLFLRGNIDCAIHPDRHTPPTDRAWWRRVLGIQRAAGCNHIRFHTWCPPEAAFAVADELGLYLQVETAFWVDDWIHATAPHPPALGQDPQVDAWIEAEARRILRTYGHHPSFTFLCLGNEFGRTQTDWERVEDLVARLDAATDTVLVTGTTARRSVPADAFWVTHATDRAVRGTGPPHTDWDFCAALEATDKPVIAHETGQRPSWPDYPALLPKFGGVMQPWNLRRLRDQAEAAGCVDHRRRAEASARFALLQYRSEHEALRRTAGLAGYQWLMLHDFTGQGEAHVGLLDPFYDAKPGIDLAAIRQWNGPTVPLARFAGYAWTTDQVFTARLQVAHEGPGPLAAVAPRWSLCSDGGGVVAAGALPSRDVPDHGLTDLGRIQVPLAELPAPAALRLRLQVGPFTNHWTVWVYPPAGAEAPEPAGLRVVRNLDAEAWEALKQGQHVVLLCHGAFLPGSRSIRWASTYWTGAWGWGSGLGLLIDPNHPALAGFPTAGHSDWQWWDVLRDGQAVVLPAALADRAAIVEHLADFHHPAREACLFALRVGPGVLVVCTLDLSRDLDRRPAARALRRSVLAWAATPDLTPAATLTPAAARDLLTGARFGDDTVSRIEADSAQPGYEAARVLDGDPATLWHTPWGTPAPGPPHHLVLDLGRTVSVGGLDLLPRQDGSDNGCFGEVAVFRAGPAGPWQGPLVTAALTPGHALQRLRWAPVALRRLKLEIRSECRGRSWASLAELAVVPAPVIPRP